MQRQKIKLPFWFQLMTFITGLLAILAIAPYALEGFNLLADEPKRNPTAVPTVQIVQPPTAVPTATIQPKPTAVPTTITQPTSTAVPAATIQPPPTASPVTVQPEATQAYREFLLACWSARNQGRRVSPKCPGNEAGLLGTGR